jgi:hypothetical protein
MRGDIFILSLVIYRGCLLELSARKIAHTVSKVGWRMSIYEKFECEVPAYIGASNQQYISGSDSLRTSTPPPKKTKNNQTVSV